MGSLFILERAFLFVVPCGGEVTDRACNYLFDRPHLDDHFLPDSDPPTDDAASDFINSGELLRRVRQESGQI